ncbi:MAG TPA: DNA repair protein RecO [Tepidisphaeraceae bacterium]|nr:DNA repair protein RecO [Tepidisphaeraceae bacterium]
MPLVADRCICLRKIEFSETSQILTLFARQGGVVRVIAKGAHRTTKVGASKFGGGIDLLDVAEAVFSHAPHRELPPLTEWRLTEGHRELRRNLRAIYLGTYAAELVTTLVHEHDPHVELFDRLEQSLREVATARREQAFLAFTLDLLRETGLMPELNACINCGQPMSRVARAAFAIDRGGVACGDCAPNFSRRVGIDPRLLRVVQTILTLPRLAGQPQRLPGLTRNQTDPLNRLLAEHIRFSSARELRLARYILAPSA